MYKIYSNFLSGFATNQEFLVPLTFLILVIILLKILFYIGGCR